MKVSIAVVVIVISAGVLVVGWWIKFLDARDYTIPWETLERKQMRATAERQRRQQSPDHEDLDFNFVG